MAYAISLRGLISKWIKERDATWEWLFLQARLSPSISTGIRNSPRYKPRQETLWKLSRVMGVRVEELLRSASYSEAEWEAFGDSGLTEPELEILSHFRLLPSDIQDSLLKLTKQLLGPSTRRRSRRPEGQECDNQVETE